MHGSRHPDVGTRKLERCPEPPHNVICTQPDIDGQFVFVEYSELTQQLTNRCVLLTASESAQNDVTRVAGSANPEQVLGAALTISTTLSKIYERSARIVL